MLNTCEDDTKSLMKLIKVYHGLLYYTGVKKDDLDGRWKSFKVVKKAMENQVLLVNVQSLQVIFLFFFCSVSTLNAASIS
jgi:hypothetical protein